ncbi:Lrp/AsnC family transcriptional regulator [Streptomyces sp. bgisy091]|uniref:Lrp/AsnC family transcriptional regulator n=1 Tax=Streptomyces sp. bgisy091 TaxID=3413778 RepID=UPI003D751099
MVSVLSALDRTIVQLLRRSPRASLEDLATRCEVSERTVRRHIDALRENGVVHLTSSLVNERITRDVVVALNAACEPGASQEVAASLARREDIRFAAVTVGSQDVVAELVAPDRAALVTLLTRHLPAVRGVTRIEGSVVLESLIAGLDWDPDPSYVSPRRARARAGTAGPGPVAVDDMDRSLEQLLRQDCRMPVSALARTLGLSPRAVGQRMARLLDSETLVLRCEAPAALLGYPWEIRFGAEVEPRRVDDVLRHLAHDPAVSLLDVTSGRHTVVGHALYRSAADSAGLLRSTLAQVPGVRAVDLTVLLETAKRSWRVPGSRDAG